MRRSLLAILLASHAAGELIGIAEYKAAADVIFGALPRPPLPGGREYPPALTRALAPCLARGAVVFVDAPSLGEFFDGGLHDAIGAPYVLVSGDSDLPSPGRFRARLDDAKLLHWYATNPDVPAADRAARVLGP